jgi:EAL domain-containing protein (putative c-di-GMP-specific phosphodiesterase class I)
MAFGSVRGRRSAVLALVAAALFRVDIPYQAGFFGIHSDASLAHLHIGFLLAVAMLYRDRLPLVASTVAVTAAWLLKLHASTALTPVVYLEAAMSAAFNYLVLRQVAAWMGWPRERRAAFSVADVSRFVVLGMVVLPSLLAGSNAMFSLLFDPQVPGLGLLANGALQVFFAKCFGVMVLTLPVVVLVTHERSRGGAARHHIVLPWRLLLFGIALPSLLLHLAMQRQLDVDTVLRVLLDNRLLIAAVLVWSALRLRLCWSMAWLVFAQLLFATSLARHAGPSVHLDDVASLLRIGVECMMLELLVVLLLLYSNEREAASAQHERDSLTEPSTGLPNLAALRRRCAPGLPTLGFLLLDRTEKVSAGIGLVAQAALLRWVSFRLRGLAEAYYIGTGQLALMPAASPAGGDWDGILQRLHTQEFIWIAHRIRVLPYLGVAGTEGGDETLDERLQRASHAAIEAKQRGELHWLQAEADTGSEHLAQRQRALRRSTVVFSRIRAGEVDLHFQRIAPLAADGDNETVSGEVLCRLRDEAGHLMMPGEFMAELQHDRRMAELDLAVFRRLGDWIAEHALQLPPIGHISVNVAGQSLSSREFARELLALVERFPLQPGQLCFEVTETAAIAYAKESSRLFAQLRERGCRIAIDDFGVGFQSFERLKQIPVDVIKIDGSFVHNMLQSPRDLELVRASVMVARAFNAQTAAEYVENVATARALRHLQVDWAQGNYIACAEPIGRALLDREHPYPAMFPLHRITSSSTDAAGCHLPIPG